MGIDTTCYLTSSYPGFRLSLNASSPRRKKEESPHRADNQQGMPCNCGRKRASGTEEIASPLLVQEPVEWGPTLWTYLHVLAERLGGSGSPVVDTDQATYMEILLHNLPHILPCNECQQHAAGYITAHPPPALKGLYGPVLRVTSREWLFAFHQAVRQQKEQPLLLASPDECAALYENRSIPKADYHRFVQTVTAAIRQGWIRMDHWRKWFSHSEKLRILSGNMIL